MAKVYIIIVNWNGWADTLECLESVFRCDYQSFRVVVCDNDSRDGSLDKIKAWADKKLNIFVPPVSELKHLTCPPIEKTPSYVEYSREEAEKGGFSGDDSPLILIRNGGNLGFAGGNNVGLHYALAKGDCDYAWLLNNDTVVLTDTLKHLVSRMAEKPDSGMCGSTLLYYDDPQKVQALAGGWYCKWIGLPWHLGRMKKSTDSINSKSVENWMNYIVGASLFVSSKFLHDIGLMCEDYFLYFEETDWAIRANKIFSLAYAQESIVYHKVGRSIGTSSNPAMKSYFCDYFNIRNRIFFTRRHYPVALPLIYVVLFGAFLVRLCLGKWDRAVMIFKLVFGFADKRLDTVSSFQAHP